jgi:hypothetical protein
MDEKKGVVKDEFTEELAFDQASYEAMEKEFQEVNPK